MEINGFDLPLTVNDLPLSWRAKIVAYDVYVTGYGEPVTYDFAAFAASTAPKARGIVGNTAAVQRAASW